MFSNGKLLITIIAAIIVGIIALIKFKRQKSKEKELERIAEDRLRDQALNKALANDLYGNKEIKTNIESLPYEVDYNQSKLANQNKTRGKMMIQITSCSELSKRKFMIELDRVIKIGKSKENDIVIKSQNALPVHCEIFRYQNHAYIRDFSGNKTLLHRKKQRVYTDEKGLKLKTGDQILIGDTVLEITIIGKVE